MKTCKKCLLAKPFSEFGKHAQTKDKHRPECKACTKEYFSGYYKKNKDHLLANSAMYQIENKESISAHKAEYRKENAEKIRAWREANPTYHSHWRAENKERIQARNAVYAAANKERKTITNAAWAKANRTRLAVAWARYAAGKIQATPAWAEDFLMEEFYSLAALRTKTLGMEWEVDHIVPLRNKLVCGLHVEHNLRVVPRSVNRSKQNRYWPDMPGDNHKDRNGPERSSADDLDHTWQPADRGSGVQH